MEQPVGVRSSQRSSRSQFRKRGSGQQAAVQIGHGGSAVGDAL